MSDSYSHPDIFVRRHIGSAPADISSMLKELGHSDLSDFSNSIIPQSIHNKDTLVIPEALSESEAIAKLKKTAEKNKLFSPPTDSTE